MKYLKPWIKNKFNNYERLIVNYSLHKPKSLHVYLTISGGVTPWAAVCRLSTFKPFLDFQSCEDAMKACDEYALSLNYKLLSENQANLL